MKNVYYNLLLISAIMPLASFGGATMLPFLLDDIQEVRLIFTPTAGGDPIVATATDSGSGLEVQDAINLGESSEYTLTVEIEGTGGADLSQTVTDNAEDYLFFFAWGETLFANPSGDGNIDERSDPVNYNDADANSLPIGLSTNWITACTEADGSGVVAVDLNDGDDLFCASLP